MDPRRAAALVFTLAAACVVAFQVALALGAPWGSYAMGGTHPGRYPPGMRFAALAQAALLALMTGVVLSRSGLALRAWSAAARWAVWVVVAISAVSFALNLVTPSAGERALWAPVAFLLLVSSVVVATTGRYDTRVTRTRSSRPSRGTDSFLSG